MGIPHFFYYTCIYNTRKFSNDTESRDLQSFKIRFEFESDVPIRFESDGPIRKFRITAPATFAIVP